MLKNANGRYTDTQIERCAQMFGAFGKEMQRILNSSGLGQAAAPITTSQAFRRRMKADIGQFVKSYRHDELFSYVPGRFHEGYHDFSYTNQIRQPEQMNT